MHRHLVTSIATALVLAACGAEDGKRGPAGQPCTVTVNQGGAAVVTCPDGTSTTIEPGGSCTIESTGEGTHVLLCPGADPVVIRDGEQLPRTTLAGQVGRWGLPASGGGTVTLLELDRSTETDAQGRFHFDDVPPGLYQLRLSLPGYQPRTVANVLVFGAPVDLGAVALKLGRVVAQGAAFPLPSPSAEHVALLESGDLHLLDLRTDTRRLVAEEVMEPFFFDDRFLLYVRGPWSRPSLGLVDIETGVQEELPAEDDSIWVFSGGIGYTPRGRSPVLLRLPTMEEVELGAGSEFYQNSPDNRFVVLHASGATRVLDTETGATHSIGTASRPVFDPTSSRLAFYGLRDFLHFALLDLATGHVSWIDTALQTADPLFSPDGQVVIYRGTAGPRLLDIANDTELDLPAGDQHWISPSSRWVLSHRSGHGFDLIDRIAGIGSARTYSYSHPYRIQFNAGETGLLLSTSTGAFLVELATGGAREIEWEDSIDWTSAGDLLVSRFSGTWIVPVDGPEQRLSSERYARLNDDGSVVLFYDDEAGHLAFYLPATGTTVPLDLAMENLIFLAGPWALAVVAEASEMSVTIHFVHTETGALLPIDESVLEGEFTHAGLFYWTGRRVAEGGSDPWADLLLHWVTYP